MTQLFSNKYLVVISRLLLGSVFIIASIDKIAVPAAFAEAVHAYRLMPTMLVNIFALIIPWLELLCGVFVIAGVYKRSSSILLCTLLLLFIVAMLSAMVRGLHIDCGCFGAEHATPIGWMHVLEDFGLLLLSVHLIAYGEEVNKNASVSPL